MLQTTYEIFESPAGKTIIFHNLYFISGEFVFNGSRPVIDISTYPNVHYRHTNYETWAPSIRELPQNENISTITTPHFYFRETVYGHPGHTLTDDIFSIFYSLCRCKIDYNPCVCVVETSSHNINFYDCRGMFECLFGEKSITSHHLKNTYSSICFQTFVVGNGDSGCSSFDSNYACPFQDNIWKRFRDAFYEKSKIDLEPGNKIIYVESTRFPIKNDLKQTLEKNNIEIIHWGELQHITNQLNALKNVKIYITTEGSDSLNTIFLPDGAIVISLGRIYANGTYKALGYVSDFLFVALSYVDVLYFEDYYSYYHDAQETAPNPGDLIDMIEHISNDKKENPISIKRDQIYNNFASIIINRIHYEVKLNNYSPNGRWLLKNYINIGDREKLIEKFKREYVGHACNEEIRIFRTS